MDINTTSRIEYTLDRIEQSLKKILEIIEPTPSACVPERRPYRVECLSKGSGWVDHFEDYGSFQGASIRAQELGKEMLARVVRMETGQVLATYGGQR